MNMTPTNKAATPKKDKELTGWHVLGYMIVFFGCMFAVNGTFLYFAITTHPGEDIKKSYLQGLHYNDTLEARAKQAQLGWRAGIGFNEARTSVLVQIQDASKIDIRGMNVTGQLRHLSSRTGDQTLTFAQQADGLYKANITPPESGTWVIRMDASQANETAPIFTARKELTVP